MSSKLKIISDIDCQIYCDYEYVGDAVSGKLFHLNLRKGIYLLEFRKDPVVLATQRYKMESNDEEDLLEISLLDTYNNLQREESREKIKNLSVIWFHTGDNWRIGSTKDEILNPETTETWIDLPSSYVLLPMGQHIDPDVDCCGYIPFNIGGTLHSDDLVGYSITGGMWGCINQIGEVTIPPIYESKVFFKNDQVTTIIENKVRKETINYLGEIAFKELGRIRPIDEAQGLYETIKENQHGLINKYGQYLIHPDYDELQYVGENCIWAKGVDSKRWGLLNINSDIVLPFVYSSIHKAEGGYYVCCNGLWGSVSDNGSIESEPVYTIVAKFNITKGIRDDEYEYFSIVRRNGKYGIVNTDFNQSYKLNERSVVIQEIIPCVYDSIYSKNGNDYSDEELAALVLSDLGYPNGRFKVDECLFVKVINEQLECYRYEVTGKIANLKEAPKIAIHLDYSFTCEKFNREYMVKSNQYYFINEKFIYEEDSYDLISSIDFYDGTFDYQPNPDGWDGYSAPTDYIKVKNIRSYPIAKKDDTWYLFNSAIPRRVLFACKCHRIEQFGVLVGGENFAVVEDNFLRYLYIIENNVVIYKSEAMSSRIDSPYSCLNKSNSIVKSLKINLDDRYKESLANDYFIAELATTKKWVVMKWSTSNGIMLCSKEYDNADLIDECYAEVAINYKGRTLYNTIYTANDDILQISEERWKLSPYEARNLNMVAEYNIESDKEGIIRYTSLNSNSDIREDILYNNICRSDVIVPFVWDYARVYGSKWHIIMVGNYVNNRLKCAIMDECNHFLTGFIYSEIYDSGANTCAFNLENKGAACCSLEDVGGNPYFYLPFADYEKYVNGKLVYFNPFGNVRLYIDTETTGLPIDYKEHYTKLENWPYIVQVALIIEDDNYGILAKRDIIVKPDGYTIPESASNIHGITNEKAKSGEKREDVFNYLDLILNNTDIIIGHNASFDLNIIKAEIIRTKGIDNALFEKKEYSLIDTMRLGKDVCKIPRSYIYGDYKYPKLNELYYKLFNKHFDNQHNAMADVEATYECYKELLRLGIYR